MRMLCLWVLACVAFSACKQKEESAPLLVNPFITPEYPRYEQQIDLPLPPHRLSSAEMRAVALEVWRSEGLSPVENHFWTKGLLDFSIDVHDIYHRIGVTMLDLPTPFDCFRFKCEKQPYLLTKLNSTNPLLDAWERQTVGDDADLAYKWLNAKKPGEWTSEEKRLAAMMRRITRCKPTEEDKWFFYEQCLVRNHDSASTPGLLIRQEHIWQAVRAHDQIKLDAEFSLLYLERKLDSLGILSSIKPYVLERYSADFRAAPIRLETLIQLLHAHYAPASRAYLHYKGYNLGMDTFFNSYRSQWKEEVSDRVRDIERLQLSYVELGQLGYTETKNELFVAVVNTVDRRFRYTYPDDALSISRLQGLPQDSIRARRAMGKEAALQRLEDNLRMYVRWAKSRSKPTAAYQ
jgi:hypothetical protein